jgi:HlyD family secretion protein
MNFLKNKKIRNWGITIAVMIVAILVVWEYSSANAISATENTESKVITLDIAEMIEASGSLEAQPFASLSWKTGGVVEVVNVKPGDFVKADSILLTLDPTSTSASIVSAQADLVTAQKNLDDILTSGTNLAQAMIDLKNSQEDYDDAVYYLRYLQTDNKVPQTTYSAKLVKSGNGWRYDYTAENFKGVAPKDWIIEAENDLALKKGELEDAQRDYDRLLAGDTSSDVIAAQAKVDAAQATVNQLSIIAPFDGQVLSVDSHVGDMVSTGDLSVNIADMDHLYVEAQVDESDVANVKVGQQAEVTLDAVSGVTLTGKVTAINPVGENVSGLVKYTVRVDLDKVDGDTFMPLSTTANVTITVKEASAVLTVPITAIQNDALGEFVWLIQSDGSTKRVDVVSGSIVGDQVIVTGSLQAGDRIQLVQTSSVASPNALGPLSGGK